MIAHNRNSICEEARLYYYDYICDESNDNIPSGIFDHIDDCCHCKAEADTLKMQLTSDQHNTSMDSEARHFAVIGHLKHHFAYAGHLVTCSTAKLFLPGLSDPSLEIKVPTPITVHIDKCEQCREDLGTIRQAGFAHKQLCRLAQLFAEKSAVNGNMCIEAKKEIETIAIMTFGGISAEVLRHICVCSDCREALYNAREHRCKDLVCESDKSDISCEAVSDADIFDYVFPYGIDPDKDEYAMFRKSLTCHLANCTKCLGKMQILHNAIYGILGRQESGISTCVNMDVSFQGIEIGDNMDAYADWPFEVQVNDQPDKNEKINANKINITTSPNTAHTSWKINLKRFAKPIAAAAVIVLAISIFFNASVAEAIDLDQVYKALRKTINIHMTTYTHGTTELVNERWIARELNLMVAKSSTEWVLWDVGEKSMRSKDVSQQTVKTTAIQKDALTKIKQIIAMPVGLSPFDNTQKIPRTAEWHKSPYLPDSILDEGIATYDLTWASISSHGVSVYNKLRCYIESDTKLPKKIEVWQKLTDKKYKLINTLEFDYPTENNIQSVIKEAGF